MQREQSFAIESTARSFIVLLLASIRASNALVADNGPSVVRPWSYRTRNSAVAKMPHDASCIASIQNVERSLLLGLLVVSASDIPLRTIKFFSVFFSSAYSSML